MSNVPSADPALSLLPLRLVFASRESLVGERKGNYLSQERLLIARSLTRLVSCIVDSENRSRMIKKVRREISNIHGNRLLMALSLSPMRSERERARARSCDLRRFGQRGLPRAGGRRSINRTVSDASKGPSIFGHECLLRSGFTSRFVAYSLDGFTRFHFSYAAPSPAILNSLNSESKGLM